MTEASVDETSDQASSKHENGVGRELEHDAFFPFQMVVGRESEARENETKYIDFFMVRKFNLSDRARLQHINPIIPAKQFFHGIKAGYIKLNHKIFSQLANVYLTYFFTQEYNAYYTYRRVQMT